MALLSLVPRFHILFCLSLCALLWGCSSRELSHQPTANANNSLANDIGGPSPATEETIELRNAIEQSGITFVHDDGSYGKFLLPETMSGGLALFDYDNDGRIDILFYNGIPLDPHRDRETVGMATSGPALYRNLGQLKFRDVTQSAGLHCPHFGVGGSVGDFDNDGFSDVFFSNFGPNALFRNNGSGGFDQIEIEFFLNQERFSAGASFFDVDLDGDLDLFVANYVRLSTAELEQQVALGRTIYPSPQDFRTESNQLLINLGDGSWSDGSRTAHLDRFQGTGMGCVTGDFDGDGDMDIYVANDELPNSLLHNDGQGVFDEVALAYGVALDSLGKANGSMGVDMGDVDGDGLPDLIVTSFENEAVNVYRASGQHVYQDISRASGIAPGTLSPVTWGCCLADFDLDGDLDIYMATGHLDNRRPESYRAPDLVFKNLLMESKQIRFVDISRQAGDVGDLLHCGRGAAVADLDNDGDLDVVVQNIRQRPSLLENRSTRVGGHWLELQLVGRICNRGAVGTRVRVVAEQASWVDEVRNGRGYQSYWGDRLHFGLGQIAANVRLEITWADGSKQIVESIAVDQRLTIVQPH